MKSNIKDSCCTFTRLDGHISYTKLHVRGVTMRANNPPVYPVTESALDHETFIQYLNDYRERQRPQISETWAPQENGVNYER